MTMDRDSSVNSDINVLKNIDYLTFAVRNARARRRVRDVNLIMAQRPRLRPDGAVRKTIK